jgi:hypothetical protein
MSANGPFLTGGKYGTVKKSAEVSKWPIQLGPTKRIPAFLAISTTSRWILAPLTTYLGKTSGDDDSDLAPFPGAVLHSCGYLNKRYSYHGKVYRSWHLTYTWISLQTLYFGLIPVYRIDMPSTFGDEEAEDMKTPFGQVVGSPYQCHRAWIEEIIQLLCKLHAPPCA